MKKFLNATIVQIFLIGSLLFVGFLNTGCSNSNQVIDKVCDYGSVLCDVSTSLCTQVPGVPEPVCQYLDLACYNLNELCMLRDSTIDDPKVQNALNNLTEITAKLREWNAKRVLKE